MGTSFFTVGRVKRKQEHRILMSFALKDGWQISFQEEDLRTTLAKRLVFADPVKILEMEARWGGKKTAENRRETERALEKGRGSIWLKLSEEQYRRLKTS